MPWPWSRALTHGAAYIQTRLSVFSPGASPASLTGSQEGVPSVQESETRQKGVLWAERGACMIGVERVS